MRVKVIINPAAGKPEPVLSVLNDVLGKAGIEWDVAITHEAGDAEAAAREAARKGYDLVGAYGGDGTVTEVAAGVGKGGPPILLLPGGTGNALADDLGIPSDLAAAVALAVGDAGVVRRVDVGRSGTRRFVLRMTMGFEAAMARDTTREAKDRYGWLAYLWTGIQQLADPPTAAYTITVDGEVHECEGIGALIANSASTGVAGVKIADDVDVSDGLLDVAVLQKADLATLLGSVADAAQGQTPRMMTRWRGKKIRVLAKPAQEVSADGEEAGKTPLDVSVMPGAVGVLVPKPAKGVTAKKPG